jgi:hypothetical protein
MNIWKEKEIRLDDIIILRLLLGGLPHVDITYFYFHSFDVHITLKELLAEYRNE